MSIPASVLSSVFSDETEVFRSPAEPNPGDSVAIRIRLARDAASRVILYTGQSEVSQLMLKDHTDAYFDWYVAHIVCNRTMVSYRFVIEYAGGGYFLYDKGGPAELPAGPFTDAFNPSWSFRFMPGFHVPSWSVGAVQYQIFTDRFCNGDPTNDVTDNEYYYVVGHAKHVPDWYAVPGDTDIRCFYGGDLQGILNKLDYLQDLGIEVLYLNPIFVSPSSHKYDTQDYEHIDPHFGVISTDTDHAMEMWEKHNGYAQRYISRVASPENLSQSDDLFARLCSELHRRGMKIILDGVFNHCGSFNKWMDYEGIYFGKEGFEPGAWQSPESPYRSFFRFQDSGSGRGPAYEGWWGYSTLPKLNYEDSPALVEEILKVAEKWASPPYSIDGWRLDVAADLGHSAEFNHSFWREFRKRVKAANPDLIIIAEHYGDPSTWLEGDQWDTIMNYDAFMEPVTWFMTGMEKHSDSRRDDLYRNGAAFFDIMRNSMARFEFPSLLCAMNELSNHDHSRFLTRTNRMVGRAGTVGSQAAGENLNHGVFRAAVALQMTWPGAPTVYYADEAGQVGWTDPDNRRTYPWGREDASLIELHRDLIALRTEHPVLKFGSLKPLLGDYGRIAYGRFDTDHRMITAINNTENSSDLSLFVRDIGAADGEIWSCLFMTTPSGHNAEKTFWGKVDSGVLTFTLPPFSSVILCNETSC